jgi:hypothetical protein
MRLWVPSYILCGFIRVVGFDARSTEWGTNSTGHSTSGSNNDDNVDSLIATATTRAWKS